MKYINQKCRKPTAKKESIFETEMRLKQEAKELSKNYQDLKPIKYLLK